MDELKKVRSTGKKEKLVWMKEGTNGWIKESKIDRKKEKWIGYHLPDIMDRILQ